MGQNITTLISNLRVLINQNDTVLSSDYPMEASELVRAIWRTTYLYIGELEKMMGQDKPESFTTICTIVNKLAYCRNQVCQAAIFINLGIVPDSKLMRDEMGITEKLQIITARSLDAIALAQTYHELVEEYKMKSAQL